MFKQCVNSLEYKYTQKDLLENPEKYQRSKFEGIEFIFIFLIYPSIKISIF